MKDPIVSEIRKYRQEHAQSFNYDLDSIFDDLQRKEQESGRKVVSRPPRRPKQVLTAK